MHVDRQKYLLLVSAIAAGCGGSDQPATVVAPPVIATDPEPGGPPEDMVVVVEPSGEPTTGPPATAAPTQEDLAPPAWGPPTQEAIGAGPLATSGGCRARHVVPPAARGCRDDVGRPGSCNGGPLASACRRMSFHCSQCESYKRYFKPRVAERAVSCVRSQRPRQYQDGCQTYRCADEALKGACPDKTAATACRSIARQCGESQAACTQMLSGMNAAGRAQVGACAARGCSYGLWSCIEGM